MEPPNWHENVYEPYSSQSQAPLLTNISAGTVNVCSPDHISLLIHQTFNVSIPRHHVPESWEFEHGAAENDPEFQLDGFEYDAVTGPNTTAERGQWVSGATGDKIGGLEGKVEFTVVG